ncbi:MAG: alpha/beta hydrolase [Gammaproteobacteria bacterium]|nr:alpha/beta hydrolase [Gammaproteobacteria bacterium]
MKKLLLSVAVGSALGLTACVADGDDAPVTQEEARTPFTRVVFDPANGQLPIPSDILLGGTTDGTLNIPVSDPTNFGDPQVAINSLDGWSTTMPLTFNFAYAQDSQGNRVAINGQSVTSPGGIRIFKTVMGGDTRDAECAPRPAGTACRVVGELEYGPENDFIVTYANRTATVVPVRPLEPKTGYLVVLTDGITDELGRAVRPSQTYAVARNPDVTLDGEGAGLQNVIRSYEAALSSFGLSPSRYAYASGFTTQSVDDVLQTVQGLMSVGQIPVGAIQAQNTGNSVADALVAAGAITSPSQAATIASAADLYGGQFSAPYFSPIPTEGNPAAPRTGFWQAQFISVASIVTALRSGDVEVADLLPLMERPEDADPANPQSLAGQIPFAVAAADEDGAGAVLADLDANRNLTKFNPIPAVRALQDLPFVMSVPNVAVVNAIRQSMEMPTISEPEDGWPVVIFQHGIGGNKEQALAIAGTLALSGQAMIAIDHPLHGARDFGSSQFNAGSDPTAYLNLSSLLTARDNLRQSTSDLLALRHALGQGGSNFGGANIDGDNVKFIGHSLGAIVGTNFLAVANSPHMFSEQAAQLGVSFDVDVAALGMPGGGIASFLLESQQFGPVIGGLLSYQQIAPFRQAANAAIENNGGPAPGSAAFNTFIAQFYVQFFAEAPAALVAARDELLTQFRFAAQTVIDSADPVNYAALARSTEIPMILIQADGDTVIPNTTAYPTAGTAPLARLLGLPVVTESVMGEEPVSAYLRYVDATHGSLLSPGNTEVEARVLQSIQQTVGVYMQSNGLVLAVDEDELR